MSNNICFKSVIVISLFRLVITGNCFGSVPPDINLPRLAASLGLTCNSDCSGIFQRRCAVNVTDGNTMHAALLRNDFTDVKKKDILTARADTFDSELKRSKGNQNFEPLCDQN